MKLNPGVTELVKRLLEHSDKVIIKRVGTVFNSTSNSNAIFQVMPSGREGLGYTFQLNGLTVVEGVDVFLCKILMCPSFDSANLVFSPTSLGYLVAFFDKSRETIAAGHGCTLDVALNRAAEIFDNWCEKQKEKPMIKKTRNEILGDLHDLRMYLETSTYDNVFPPSLVHRVVKALAEFDDVVREMDLFPSNEAVLEMLKEKINHGFLKESQVVDVLIENTRAKREEDK